MKFLVATDFSGRSDRALNRAAGLARQLSADLVVAHVVDDDRPAAIVDSDLIRAEALLRDIASRLDLPTGRCEWRIATGEAFDGVLRLCEEQTPTLLVLGAHRRRILQDVFIGTTAERVLRSAKLPVLMVNGESTRPYRRILAAIDLQEGSAAALRAVEKLGIARDVVLTALHAFDAPARGLMIRTPATLSDIEDYVAEERRRAMTTLRAFLELHCQGPVLAAVEVIEESAAATIQDHVHRTDSDLIVVGTRGRSGLGRLLLGSVAEELLRRSDVDVLAVPPEGDDAPSRHGGPGGGLGGGRRPAGRA